jgi:hypothetical protein
MQLENAGFEFFLKSELHVPRATFIVSGATTTTFFSFLKKTQRYK